MKDDITLLDTSNAVSSEGIEEVYQVATFAEAFRLLVIALQPYQRLDEM